MRSRSFRRHHKQRILRRWETFARRWGITTPGWAKKYGENMPICSEPGCCGNPRRLGQLSRDELKANDRWLAELSELVAGEEEKNDLEFGL